MKMMGMGAVSGSALRRRATSKPSMPGITASSSTISGSARAARTIKFSSKIVEVPARTYTGKEVERMTAAVVDAEAKAKAVADSSADAWTKHAAEARLRRFQDLVAKWRQPASRPPIQVRIEALRIGELAIVSMPGEPFAEIGQAVKRGSFLAATMFCGYSSGEGGEYMPVEDEYDFEGYEVDRTPYGTGAAAKVMATAAALLAAVR